MAKSKRAYVLHGPRVTVRHSQSMTLRLIEVGERGDPLESDAYHRLVSRSPLCRVVDRANGYVYLRTRGSRRTFIVPASSVVTVKTEKSATKRRKA